MRETKFRAISARTYEWVYGSLVVSKGYNYIVLADADPSEYPGSYVDCIDLTEIQQGTEGQYTGLKDKNGKEIYEADILDIFGTSCEIIYSFCMFKISNGFLTQALTEAVCPANPEAEIIGNIYENPELMEST